KRENSSGVAAVSAQLACQPLDFYMKKFGASGLAFPDDIGPVPQRDKVAHRKCVTRGVALQLGTPIVRIAFGTGGELAAVVRMPEAPMNEDNPSTPLIGDVRLAGQSGRVFAEAYSKCMQGCTNPALRRGAFGADTGHDFAAREGRALRSGPQLC